MENKLNTKITQKNMGHCARSRAKDDRNSLPDPWIQKQYRVLGVRARASSSK